MFSPSRLVTSDARPHPPQTFIKPDINFGGASGSPWTQTLEKMALPGMLFHHSTPTKVWYHDLLAPWVHYVPVALDLSDLRQKYDWAEAHPLQAQAIAEEGTKFARWLGSREGMEYAYNWFVVEPLRNVIRAHKTVSKAEGLKAMREMGFEDGFNTVITRCTGTKKNSCEKK